jgi:hypothetical protein
MMIEPLFGLAARSVSPLDAHAACLRLSGCPWQCTLPAGTAVLGGGGAFKGRCVSHAGLLRYTSGAAVDSRVALATRSTGSALSNLGNTDSDLFFHNH